ncbi:MAG TPA: hypothetical protein VL832_29950 [Puia sp.]|nr:hypothetical protein [Puia sp.]
MIREVDPEISYIDYLAIVCKGKDGSIKEYPSNNLQTRRKDKQYLVLHQGNSIKISFGSGIWYEEKYMDVYLISHGYYIPTRSKK